MPEPLQSKSLRLRTLNALRLAACVSAALLLNVSTFAGEREQAKTLHDRIAGVPPTPAILDNMASSIASGDALGAAFEAMNNPSFYNVTLKNFAAPWTNRAQSVFVPLNDYSATVIGMVRDDVPFNTLLSADLVYTGGNAAGVPAYSMTDNAHFEALENQNIDLSQALTSQAQSQLTDLPATATAGVMTTRAAAEAFFIDGTNRAMFRFTLLNHMCSDLEQVKDISRSPDRIRQDVSRSPGGDSRIFLNRCIGCHAGMDPLAQAFAYYDFDENTNRLVYRENTVDQKYSINSTNFEPGFVTPDDSWSNYWREGQNASLGWDPNLPGGGNGAKSMGEELANSEAFAQCQVTKVFRNVCFRAPADDEDRSQIDAMVNSFKNSNYSLKQVFAESAVYCMGE
ncbi:MAG: hypothetical protein AB8G18_09480 [Gammaproteobacteria bacterium]